MTSAQTYTPITLFLSFFLLSTLLDGIVLKITLYNRFCPLPQIGLQKDFQHNLPSVGVSWS
jgi:hypothetical protein